jgi:hypothetical protein
MHEKKIKKIENTDGGNRIHDQQVKSLSLYQLSYDGKFLSFL